MPKYKAFLRVPFHKKKEILVKEFYWDSNLCAPGSKSNLLYQVILTRWLMNVSDQAYFSPIYTLLPCQGLPCQAQEPLELVSTFWKSIEELQKRLNLSRSVLLKLFCRHANAVLAPACQNLVDGRSKEIVVFLPYILLI